MKPISTRSTFVLLSVSLLLPLLPISPVLAVGPQAITSQSAQPKPNHANVKISKEKALQLATNFAKPSAELIVTDTSLRTGDAFRPFPEWTFQWTKKSDEPSPQGISVSIHAETGELTAYYSYGDDTASKPSPLRLRREDAQKIVEQFLRENMPTKNEQVRLYQREMPVQKTPLGATVMHMFHFARVVHDIIVPENSMDITVDGTGKVVSFQLTWNDQLVFEKPTQLIGKEAALDHFTKEASTRTQLSYMMPWDSSGKASTRKPSLVYQNPFSFYVDAKTGKPLSKSFTPLTPSKPDPVSSKALPAHHTGEPLTQEQAVKIAQKVYNLKNFKLHSSSYRENAQPSNRPVWDLLFMQNTQPTSTERTVNMSIDAKTGDIVSFALERGYSASTNATGKKQTQEQLRTKTKEYIRTFSPSLAVHFSISESDKGSQSGLFPNETIAFKRYVNGISATTNESALTFDGLTGELLYYFIDFGSDNYPNSIPVHRPAADAKTAWLNETEIEPAYLLEQLPEDAYRQSADTVKQNVHLVYRAIPTLADHPYAYDAIDGTWKSIENGKTVILHRQEPSDIKDHVAEQELRLMYEYDAILLENGKLLPNKTLTRGEAIMMLMAANVSAYPLDAYASRQATFADVAKNSRFYNAVEAAVDNGLFDKSAGSFQPEEAITKEELAVLFVRSLGLKKLASYSDLFKSNLSDITASKERGSVAIVTALGIMQADNGQFRPAATLSRGEAARAFARFFEKRAELVESKEPRHHY